jgi:hypothetical protein
VFSTISYLFSLLVLLVVSLGASAQPVSCTDGLSLLREGDLLFCVSADDNNITRVTQGLHGARIDHVGIVHFRSDSLLVLEAVHQGVVLTPIDSFLKRRDSLVFASRLRDTTSVHRSVVRALCYLGHPYDFFFMPDDSAMYCSELVQKNYLDAQGNPIFPPIPMSFHDESGVITPYWRDYYGRHGLAVPEGAPGSNPGQLSRCPLLEIVFDFRLTVIAE